MAYEPPELYVHTEETGDESRRHEHEGNQCEHLHDLVLIEVDDTENSILKILKTLETEVCMIDQRRDILEQDIKPWLILLRIVRTLEDA